MLASLQSGQDRTQGLPDIRVARTCRADGAILLDHPVALPSFDDVLPRRLAHWARLTPQAPYLTERDRTVCYQEADQRRAVLAARLLTLPGDRTAPILFLGGNGIDHALTMLAATSVGIAVAVVAPAYATATAAPYGKLAKVLETVRPRLVLADDVAVARAALDAIGAGDVPVRTLRDLAWLDALPPAQEQAVRDAEDAVGPDTVAKLLFTSGSTGSPKPVSVTQRMMVSNMQGLSMVWPFLAERPPSVIDWLPWSHTFGGNCCFNIVLWFGGHLEIDQGRPVPGLIEKSVERLRARPPSLYFNVPLGYEMLLPFLEQDSRFAADFLGSVDFLFSAGATLPPLLRERLERVCLATIGRVPLIAGGWGSTETAPFSMVLSFDTAHPGNLGMPMPGTTIKMVPDGDRYELRVKGPNVTPGYWTDTAATAAAFDEEGFFRIGDAGRFADPADPSAGVLFDGRISENFKLLNGTFVNVGKLRIAAVDACGGLVSDAVIVGENRSELGALLFVNEGACRALIAAQTGDAPVAGALAAHPLVRARIAACLEAYNGTQTGSSSRFVRFLVMDEPPSAGEGEITDKGYINQRQVLKRRAGLVDALYATGRTS